ncbi:hypothetical protein K0504_04840 [Neiella marina]|uniref:Uncharacterized protein n=1 Tax=Neiella holothuriorum TaxID=2870530 RepID=A0ABS7EDN2_9GAMM|nr:hypothetical protein [Neiella holothuriorum]MBW8190355.1 hypothetical protein [Neiella holothuriorum]
MNASDLHHGMIVDFNNQAVEVLSINNTTGIATVRKCSSYEHTQAEVHLLVEDPQLHTDSYCYY